MMADYDEKSFRKHKTRKENYSKLVS